MPCPPGRTTASAQRSGSARAAQAFFHVLPPDVRVELGKTQILKPRKMRLGLLDADRFKGVERPYPRAVAGAFQPLEEGFLQTALRQAPRLGQHRAAHRLRLPALPPCGQKRAAGYCSNP